MIKTVVTTIAAAALSMSVMAQKDSAAIKIKKDTIKPKETGALILNGNLLAFGPQTDSSKTKPVTKPDTLKTGSIKSTEVIFLAMGPQTDSLKAKPKAVDTVKTGSKYATDFVLKAASLLAYAPGDGPQTDSSNLQQLSNRTAQLRSLQIKEQVQSR
jgi:hypothetical protein